METDVNFYSMQSRKVVPANAAGRQRVVSPEPARPAVVSAPVAEPSADLALVVGPHDPRLTQLLDLMRRYFRIEEEVFARDADCQHAVMSAAALCLNHGFFPGRHVYVRKIAGQWQYETGYRAWLDSANQMAKEQRFRFDVEIITMTDEEVRRYLGVNYSRGDCGFFARVLEDRLVTMYARMGRDYDPEYSIGFWRKLAFQERDANNKPTGEWLPDPIYPGRDAKYTAELRARKAALMKVYSLVELNNHPAERRLQTLLMTLNAELEEGAMKERDRRDPRMTAFYANARQPTAADPDMIFAQ